ncbi:MAG: dickkopf-related protein [Pseudomonadota bacterium]|nr:MAG: hypothetical protein DIU78_07660 [Pseudomonadota bacterium]
MVRSIGLAAGIALAFGACADSTEERIRAKQLAQGCTHNSDCEGDLVCMFGRCHVQCYEDEDCRPPLFPYQSRCVRASSGVNVCQLDSDRECSRDGDCQGDQVCAADAQCRDACTSEDACIAGLVCSATGECARDDELTDDGALSEGSGGSGGGPSGSGGAPAEGAEAGAGGDVNDGAAGPGAAGSGGEGGAPGGAEGGAPGGAAGADDGAESPRESEPNDSRDEPNELLLDTDIRASISHPDDADYFFTEVPASPAAGGYYRILVTDVGPGAVLVQAYSALNHDRVYYDDPIQLGKSVFGFFTGAPGAAFYLSIARRAGTASESSFDYTLRVEYTAIDDPYEPNDTQLEPAAIAIGEPVKAYLFAGLESATASAADFEDWYSVEAEAGLLKVEIKDVPLDVRMQARVYESTLTPVGAEEKGVTNGAPLSFERELPSSETYLLRLTYVGGSAQPATAGRMDAPDELPDHFTRPYTLTLTQ